MSTPTLSRLFVCFLMLAGTGLRAQEAEPFEISDWGRVKVTFATPEFFEALKPHVEKAPKITLTKEAPGETLEALQQLEWITELEIRSDVMTDLSALSAFKNLKSIKLYSMDMAKKKPLDISPLKEMAHLEEFESYATPITGLDALAGKESLKVVNLYMAAVSSLEFLNTTPNVEELDLYGSRHTFPDYTPVAGLKKLKDLNIYMNEQAVDEKLAVLSELTSLEAISMSNCKEVTTLDFLANSKGMTKVRALWCDELKDLSALNGMVQMERLELHSAKAEDFRFLTDMTQLQNLNLENTSFSDLSLLPPGAPLVRLNLDNTSVTSLEGIQNYPKLSRLEFSRTEIRDLSPVLELQKLRTLELPKEITEEDRAKVQEALPKVRIR